MDRRMKPVITATDLAAADTLLDAFAKRDRKTVARVLAESREVAIQCASVRVEREYGLVQRALPVPSNGDSGKDRNG